MKPVTLKQIASEVNKTAVTVSKALRDHPDISPSTKAEVQAAAARLGYTPNLIARKLSSRQKRTLGLVVPKVAHPLFSEAIEAIYDEAHQREYDIFMMVSGEDAGLESHHVKTLLSLQVDGFLISVTERTADMSSLEAILSNNKQLVFFDRVIDCPRCSSVVCDDYGGSYELVSFAAENGYNDFGCIAGYASSYIGRERRRGFEQALVDHGLEVRRDCIVEGGFDQSDGYAGMMKLSKASRLPRIICTVSFSAALGALKAIRELGLAVPDDLEIMSFGDSEYNAHMKPSITAARLDAREMGKRAVDLLIEQITNPDAQNRRIVVPTRLVVHETGLGPSEPAKNL